MKKSIVITILLCLSQLSKAQDFQFQMFFEDAIGNKDTLTIGYDINGTELIDPLFGETNIIGIPLDSSFDVRISDAIYYPEGNPTFHTKKQIVPYSCKLWGASKVSIDIKCKNWPVTVEWDHSLFNASCRSSSVFTSYHPGGWFDVGGHPSNLNIANLNNPSPVTFTSNYNPSKGFDSSYAYVNSSNDTIPVFWMGFRGSEPTTSTLENVPLSINSYPNPITDYHYLDLPIDLIEEVRIIDIRGESKIINYKHGYLDFRSFQDGFYVLIVEKKDGKLLRKKIIKE